MLPTLKVLLLYFVFVWTLSHCLRHRYPPSPSSDFTLNAHIHSEASDPREPSTFALVSCPKYQVTAGFAFQLRDRNNQPIALFPAGRLIRKRTVERYWIEWWALNPSGFAGAYIFVPIEWCSQPILSRAVHSVKHSVVSKSRRLYRSVKGTKPNCCTSQDVGCHTGKLMEN